MGILQSLGVINDSVFELNSDSTKFFSFSSVFNLSRKILFKTAIKVLEKDLVFTSTSSFIDEADLQKDFDDFVRKMRCKWYFRNEGRAIPSGVSAFKPKSTCNPPKGLPALSYF